MKKLTTLLLLCFLSFIAINVHAEGTKQLMPNSTDRLWIELNDNDNGRFGIYGCAEESRINIFMNASEVMHFGIRLPNTTEASTNQNSETNPNNVLFRIKDPNGNVVYGGANGVVLPGAGTPGFINTFDEAVTGPNGIIINGTTISGGYNSISFTAAMTGNYFIEFRTLVSPTKRCAFKWFDITVTDAAGNLVTNPGEPNIPAGRLWSKRWRFSNSSFTEYPCKAGFYVFTDDEFVNRVEFEVKPFGFALAANSFGVTDLPALNHVEKAQSVEGDNGAYLFDMSEYKIFFNDPDRVQWTNTKLPPPQVKVWFEDKLIMDYDYDRTPTYRKIDVDTIHLQKNDTVACSYSDITMFRVESNIDGFAAILLDLNADGVYTPDNVDRFIRMDIKQGLNYVLWDCKDDSGNDVPDGEFTASATFLGRGPANFPLYDVETVSGVRSQSIRPFNKLDPTIYWDDRKITSWGDNNGAMVETQKHQLEIGAKIPRIWTYGGGYQNGNVATFNTWYNAIDLGMSDIKFTFTTSTTKCINGDAPYVGDVNIYSGVNEVHTFTASELSQKFFDPNNFALANIRILSLPQNGTLRYNNNLVSINDVVAIGNIALLKYTPNNGYNGKDYFKWDAQSASNLWTLNSDTIFLTSNTAPFISDIPDQNICTSTSLNNIPFTVSDADLGSNLDNLEFTLFSHDLKVLKHNDITIGGSGANRTLSIAPNADIWGYAIIYVMVSDGYDYYIEDFALTINPNMGFTGDTTVCSGDPVEITAVEYGATYNWSFNSATVSTSQKFSVASFTPANSGIYTLTISKGGCTESRDISITASPIVSFTGDANVCEGQSISLSADETVATYYKWYKGTTQIGSSKVFSSITSASAADNAGNYTLEVSKEGCTNTSDPFAISVIPPPSTAISLNGDIVSLGWNATVTVENAVAGITYHAYIGANEVAAAVGAGTDLNLTILAANLRAGTNTVVVTAENANCELQLDNTTTVVVNTPNITVTPVSGLVTSETGTTAAFTVVLNAEPLANVTVSIASDNTAEGTVSPASLTFTPANWNSARTVTITGVNDNIDDGNITYNIITGTAASTDPNYSGMTVSDVQVTNNDDADTYGITVSSLSQNTGEDGTQGTFTVVLNSEPTANVVITLSSSNTNEGTINKSTLTFTPANWNTQQTVTVTGQNDFYNDGDVAYSIIINNAVSTDVNYNGYVINNISINNIDNDNAGIQISRTSGLVTTEGGGAASPEVITFTTTSRPYSNVTIGLTVGDPTEGSISATSIVITDANWDTGVQLTIVGLNDNIDDGDITYTITTNTASSADADYNGMLVPDISVTNTDDDAAGFTVTPTSGLTTTEAGGAAQFTVRLNSQPTGNITLAFASSNTAEGTVSPASFQFTPTNWNSAQTITIFGENDFIDDGNIAYTIVNTVSANAAAEYNALDPADVSVTNNDDTDAVGITVTPVSGLTTTEAGSTASFNVKLNSQPLANVTVSLSSSDIGEGTVAPATLTFTSANWSTNQTVTLTGVDDNIVDGNQAYTVTVVTTSAGDVLYNTSVANVTVSATNTDMGDVAGLVISPTTGLSTAENGTQASFTIRLQSEPLNNVTVSFTSTDTGEGTVSPTSVTFNNTNWNTNRTITVTGVNDAVADGNQLYQITSLSSSTDANYNGITGTAVSVTNVDGDIAGINVSAISTDTDENGGTATFTIVLTSQPLANVTIGLSSSDVSEGTLSAASVVFTTANWNTLQTITVTGQDDAIADGNITYSIITAAAVSTDVGYSGLNANNVTVINNDNGDVAGINVSRAVATTTEAGGVSTFTVVLTSEPLANVVVPVFSSNTAEGVVNKSSLTFTPANWSTPQLVTITGVNDFVDDGNIAYTIIIDAPATTDAVYAAINPADIAVTNTDNDTFGITVSPISGLITTEAGGTATFTIVLNSQPTANVTIPVSSSDISEGTVSAASVIFTPANWNTAQTITITGVNDNVDDDNQPYTIVLGAATGTDANYSGANPTDVSVINTDNNTAAIQVSATSLTTTEAGGNATFTIVLGSEPTANVVIPLSSTNTAEATVAASVTFAPANWNIPQTVTVYGQNDNIDDGNKTLTIEVRNPLSTDALYAAINPTDITVTNIDNDAASITVTPVTGLVTTEAGGTATFTIVLGSEPTANVVIGISSTDTGEGTVSASQLTFTPANWNIAQLVTVTGVNDNIDDGNVAYTIVTAVPTTTDAVYAAINPANVSVTNSDDTDAAGITVTPVAGLETTETGGTATFTVVLTSEPLANVTIGVRSDNTAEGTIVPTSLVFTPANWNTLKTVTITGVNDNIDDANIIYNIITDPAVSTDAGYSGMNAANVTVSNRDDDVAGVTVSNISAHTTEAGGTATFTVVLTSEPLANVFIGLSSGNTAEGTVAVTGLTFTPANWNTPQIVTVTGVNDFVDDGDILYSIITQAAQSTDPRYSDRIVADVAVYNSDNDAVGVAVSAPSNSGVTTEAGGAVSFTVVLESEPTANVVINAASTDTGEGTVLPAAITFTPANWNTPQTVTVTGADDNIDDGNISYSVSLTQNTTDAKYAAITINSVAITNTDNDVVGFTIVQSGGTTVTAETGTADNFTVVLNAEPLSAVQIDVLNVDATEHTVSSAALNFNSTNWNIPQTVTITGRNDFIDDGDITYNITLSVNDVNSDNQYDVLADQNISVTNTDNDAVGFTVAETGGTTTTSELATTDQFTVVLNAEPLSPVRIIISGLDASEGSLSTTTLNFNSANWNTPQTVTVTGVDDAVADNDVSYTLTLSIDDVNSDNQFDVLPDQTITVTNTDNDVAGITVSTISNNTNESGTTATFGIVLNTLPTANVRINLTSSDTGEGTVSPAFVTFTPANGQTTQTITVTGVNDFIDDGNITFNIITAAAISTDGDYSGLNAADVSVINVDNDTSRVNVTTISGNTTEAGGTAAFSVVLNCEPSGNLVIDMVSSNTAEGTISNSTLTFTTANWNTPQTVTVTGVNDFVDDGDQNYNIELDINTAATLDNLYDLLVIADVAVVNTDDDVAGFNVSAISNSTSELGTNSTFTVRLTSEPTAMVTFTLASDDETEGTINKSTLTFTTANWNTPQTVTVTGVDDNIADGDVSYTIVLNSATSTDPNYNSLNPADVTVTNLNDGTPVANNDTGVTDEDVNLLMNILANDTGIDDGGLVLTIITAPKNGTYTINADLTVNYKPNFNYYGPETMSYQICDSDGECSQADITITVNPVNDYVPLLTDDFRGASLNQTITVDVLFNDAGLLDGGIVVSQAFAPANGTIAVNPDNTINYTPAVGYLGVDTFDYQVCDRDNDCANAKVTVNVKLINYNPVAVNDYETTEVNRKVTTNVLANDTYLNDGVKNVKVHIVPAHGSAKVNTNRTITYTPNANFTGNDSITYIVTDTDGDYSLAKVYYTVTAPTNNIPLAVDDQRATAVNTPRIIDVLINDIGLADGGIVVDTTSAAANGTLIVNADNTITYTPNNGYTGYDTFNYQVCDIDNECSSATVTVNVKLTNAIPVAVRDVDATYTETKVTTNVLANDSGLNDGIKNVLVYQQPYNGTATVNPDYTVNYTPALWYNGTDSLRYIVEDTDGDVSIAWVVYTITPQPNFVPVAVDDERGTSVNNARKVDVLVNDTGLNDGGLVITLPTLPQHGTAVVNGDTVIYTPAADYLGTDTLEYRICDADGDCDTAQVVIHVKETNYVPIAINDSANVYMSTPVRTNVLANDLYLNDGVKSVTVYRTSVNGSTVVNTDNTITYTPANWYTGTDSIQYMVSDTEGDYSIATVIYTIISKPNFIPVAIDDYRGATINTPRGINVLVNDTGLNDGGLVITLPTTPANGTAVVSNDTVIYTPNNGYTGTEIFSYRVCDANGDCSTANITVNVKETNFIPVAVNDAANTFMATQVTVNVLNNDLHLNDGVKSVTIYTLPVNGSASVNTDNTINYTPANWYLGTDSLKYMVQDVDGDYSIATVIYTITKVPNYMPVANNDFRGASLNTTVNVDVLFNDTGLDDGGIIVTTATQPSHGSVTVTASNTINYSPAADYLGIDTFDYQVCDADGDCSTATVTIIVKNPNYVPLAANDAVQTYMNVPVTLNVLKNDSGLDDGLKGITIYNNGTNGIAVINSDNTLTYTPANWYLGTDMFTYIVEDTEGDYSVATVTVSIVERPDFIPVAVDDRRGAAMNTPRNVNVLINDSGLDDTPITVTAITLPVHGLASVNADNSILYTPQNSYLGFDSVQYRVCDADGDCDTATLVINIKLTNENPVAVDDIAFTNINTPVNVNVLNNDLQLGDGVDKVSIFSNTINGTAVVNADNTITYTPAKWYEGTDRFEYMVEDIDGDLSVAEVVVTISGKANNIPVAINDRRATTINTERTVNVLLNDLGLADGGIIVTAITLPVHGTSVVNTDNTIKYTPANGYLGLDSLQYRVCDIDNECDTAWVIINTKLKNEIPSAAADVATTWLNTKVNINVIKNDAGLADGGVKVLLYSTPANGTVIVLPDNTIDYTPANWYLGTDKFEYLVEDIDGDVSMAEVTITITPVPNFIPVANNDGRGTVINTQVTVDVLVNDTGLNDGVLSLTPLSNPANGSLTVNSDNTITYLPVSGFLGINTFEYKVCDTNGDCDSATVTINVKLTNALPLAVADTFSTTMSTPVTVNVLMNDTGLDDGLGKAVIYSTPNNGSVVINANRTITYTPDNWYLGTDKFQYMIHDADGDYSIAEVVIYINEKGNTIPVAVNDNRGAVVNTPRTVNVLFNDTGLDDGGIIVSAVTNPTNGNLTVNANNEIVYTPSTDYLGTETFEYKVCDTDGDCDSAIVTVNVKLTNEIPVAVNDLATTQMNTDININVLKNDTKLNDGGIAVVIYTQPANGTVVVNTDKTVTYTPANWYVGTDIFEYYVHDIDGDYSLATVNIIVTEPVNHIPTAENDSRGTVTNTSVNINVLINDTGLEDGGIVVAAASAPANGTLSVNADNTITYSPAANFKGTDSFTYSVSDIDGESATATVTVIVKDVNNVPVAIGDSAYTTMNVAVTVNILNNDLSLDDGGFGVSIFTQPTNGTVVINADNTVTYKPYNWYVGTDSFNYMVFDTDGDYSIAAVKVTIDNWQNHTPVATDDSRGMNVNTTLNIDVLHNDSGLDDGGIIVTIEANPINGAAVVTNNTIDYTPATDYRGTDTLTYRVCDIDGECSIATVAIIVKDSEQPNIVPNAVNDTVLALMNNPVTILVLNNDTGLDDGVRSVVIYEQPLNGTVVVNSDNTLTFTPANWYHSTVKFTYTVYDTDGDYSRALVVVRVNETNIAPVANNDSYNVTWNGTTNIAAPGVLTNDTDADNHSLSAVLVTAPLFGELTLNANGSFTYTHNGSENYADSFTYHATDGIYYSSQATVSLSATGINIKPVAVNDTLNIMRTDEQVSHFVLSNDYDDVKTTLSVISLNTQTDPDMSIDGKYGYLSWDVLGNVTYVLNTYNSDVSSLVEDQTLVDTFIYNVSDGQFTDSAVIVVLIQGQTTYDGLIIPNGFSPNGDGSNDYFVIENVDNFPDNKLYIYNRWGTKVYEKNNYDNSWDGRSKSSGKLVTVGTYFYAFYPTKGTKKPVKGYVHIRY